MSQDDDVDEPPTAAPDPITQGPGAIPRVELTAIECRVVGSLIEKEFLTPDIYPMTTNALTSACNQKTNRDPVVQYDAVTIDKALLELRQRNVVRRVHTPGSRSTKHRQTLDELINLEPGQLALISVLLLRGDQTIGELRQRTERQHGFEDLAETERCLEALASRPIALVRELARRPGHKETRWCHLLGDPDEAPPAQGPAPEPATVSAAGHQPSPPSHEPSPVHAVAAAPAAKTTPVAPAQSQNLTRRVEELEAEVLILRRQLRSLASQLGESLD